MPLIHFHEPHPSVNASQPRPRISSGRGGAGNIHAYTASTLTSGPTATGPAALSRTLTLPPSSLATPAKTPSTKAVFAGRGGAGNVRSAHERRTYDFEEDLRRESLRESRRLSVATQVSQASRRSVVHIGRGGAGNAMLEREDGSVSSASASSRGSVASGEGVGRRLSRWLSRE